MNDELIILKEWIEKLADWLAEYGIFIDPKLCDHNEQLLGSQQDQLQNLYDRKKINGYKTKGKSNESYDQKAAQLLWVWSGSNNELDFDEIDYAFYDD